MSNGSHLIYTPEFSRTNQCSDFDVISVNCLHRQFAIGYTLVDSVLDTFDRMFYEMIMGYETDTNLVMSCKRSSWNVLLHDRISAFLLNAGRNGRIGGASSPPLHLWPILPLKQLQLKISGNVTVAVHTILILLSQYYSIFSFCSLELLQQCFLLINTHQIIAICKILPRQSATQTTSLHLITCIFIWRMKVLYL